MERVYTPEQVAELLQVNEKTVRRWLQRGEFKGSMIGRFWRIKESDLEAFFARPPASEPPPVPDTGADRWARARAALVAQLNVLLPEGERRYLRDCGIMTLPLAQLDAVLAPLGYVLVGTKTRSPDRLVLSTDRQGQIEQYGLFELRRVEDEDDTEEDTDR